MRFTTPLSTGAVAALVLIPGVARATGGNALVPALAFSEPVDAVAVTPEGSTFVGFPWLTGEPGIEAARIVGGEPVPFPDTAWNSGRKGDDPAHAFMRVNAMRIGPDGKLWVVDVGAPAFDQPVVPGDAKILVFHSDQGALARS